MPPHPAQHPVSAQPMTWSKAWHQEIGIDVQQRQTMQPALQHDAGSSCMAASLSLGSTVCIQEWRPRVGGLGTRAAVSACRCHGLCVQVKGESYMNMSGKGKASKARLMHPAAQCLPACKMNIVQGSVGHISWWRQGPCVGRAARSWAELAPPIIVPACMEVDERCAARISSTSLTPL